jgi:hypothetical protein
MNIFVKEGEEVMKRILLISLIQLTLLVLFAFDVDAEELRPFYNGIRCEAMGGGCAAVVNDETALLINPSALGKLRDVYGTIFDPELEVNSHFQDFYNSHSFSNPFSLSDVEPSLDKNRGTQYHSKAQVFPSFVARNFGIGLYGNYLLDANMSSDGTKIDTYYRNDLAVVMGFNFSFFDGRVKLGVNSKLIDRIEVDKTDVSPTGSLSYSSLATEGLGLSTDASIMLAAPWTWLPTVTAVLHDIGGTSFDKASNIRMSTTASGHPNIVEQDMDVAAAIFPIHTNYIRSSWTIQYSGLLHASEVDDKAKLLHAGFEVNFGDVLFLRAGYNQRYWTAGVELASERFQWQLGSYGEEIGDSTTHIEDRRYTLKFAYRF